MVVLTNQVLAADVDGAGTGLQAEHGRGGDAKPAEAHL